MSTDIETRPDEIEPYRGESWDTLLAESDEVSGADFTKGDTLVGIPFMAIALTIRIGDYRHGVFKAGELIEGTGCGKKHPYMYVRTVIGPQAELNRSVARGRITQEQADNVLPGESIGFNEAGTGVYRQILAYLEAKEYLEFPEGPTDGKFGESRFDSTPDQWTILKGNIQAGSDGEPVYSADIRLYFPRGLRLSEYENEYTKEGKTRYAG